MTLMSSTMRVPPGSPAGIAGDDAGGGDVFELLHMVRRYEVELDHYKLTLIGRALREGAFDAVGVGAVQGVADVLRVDRADAARLAQAAALLCERVSLLGETLPPKLTVLADAVHSGAIDLPRAQAVLGPLTSAAAERIGVAGRDEAETRIVGYARDNQPCPAELRRYARGVINELDQDGPPPPEPHQRHELWLYRDRDGAGGTVKATLDAAGFAAIETALDALTNKTNHTNSSDGDGSDDHRGLPHRRADALVELAEFSLARNPSLPESGGERPQVHVVMRLDELQHRARGALLDPSNELLSTAQLRRLLCDCGVIPHVLGGEGQPLDVGRATRVIPAGIRRAVVLRDRGCAFPGCDRKPARCECHHIIHWPHGGPTTVNNLILLCLAHHKLIHNTGWEIRSSDGTPEFIPPTWVDPDQTPRRKPRAPQ
jgi:uncharacterized protein DUF222/HNH endonuclease